MGEQTGKIIRTIIITAVVLALITGAIVYAVVNSSDNLILGQWEAEAENGAKVTCLFTDRYENPSTKETLCYITYQPKDGKTEIEKNTYNISSGSVITFRPADESLKDSTTATFTIDKDKMTYVYERDFEKAEIVMTKTADMKNLEKEITAIESRMSVLGKWEASAMGGVKVIYEFTDEKGAGEDELICRTTTVQVDGSETAGETTYAISSDTIETALITFGKTDKVITKKDMTIEIKKDKIMLKDPAGEDAEGSKKAIILKKYNPDLK